MTADEYEAHLPSLQDLAQKYHLTPEVAFYLSRPMFQHQIEVHKCIIIVIIIILL